ncbi:glycosyltransferase family 2 protein [Pseudoalteromonas distincta]|uniref:glycosyltransferase family 2 protein n=1 Tax=Pseudoalteromonas distincta TaxID=77608 RepID=UPI00165FD443|nr:glycosyltransferase family 2 protein [Pseudoalteromonas distincta]MBD0409529.1 glycosyltransferase family 2 protein [Pseudoalteromonas distincta]
MEKVSVVIAAYNRPDFLRKALESVIKQTVPAFEIIVVDDYSKIDLQPVINCFSDQNIIYIKKAENKGVSHSRNVGIKIATGDWVSFLDDDDEYLPTRIESNLNDTNRANVSAVLCSYKTLETGYVEKVIESKILEPIDLKERAVLCGTTGLFAKSNILRKELFDESLTLGEDWDIFIRLMNHGNVYYNSEPLYLYRKGHESITTNAKKLKISEAHRYCLSSIKHREWLGEYNFKLRVAKVYLSYIWLKDNKIGWIYECIRVAGFPTTFKVLVNGMLKKILNSEKNTH